MVLSLGTCWEQLLSPDSMTKYSDLSQLLSISYSISELASAFGLVARAIFGLQQTAFTKLSWITFCRSEAQDD